MPFLAQFFDRLIRLPEMLEAHAAQDIVGFAERDVGVGGDLDSVSQSTRNEGWIFGLRD